MSSITTTAAAQTSALAAAPPPSVAEDDGDLAGATVGYVNGSAPPTTTGLDGTFTLSGGNGPLMVTGGTDTATGLAFTGTLDAPAGSTVISPLTTLVQAVVAESGEWGSQEIAVATASVDESLGLPAGTDLTTLDAAAGTLAGNAVATQAFFDAAELQDTLTLIAAAGGSTDAAMSYLAAVAGAGKPLDPGSAATVQHAAYGGALAPAAAAAIASIVSTTANYLDVQIVAAATPLDVYNDVIGASIAQQGDAAAAIKYTSDYSTVASEYATGLNATLAQTDGIAVSNDPACYCRGTRIATPHGEAAIEDLRIGDEVMTVSGHARAIRWIGRRAYAAAFAAGNPGVWPVRLAAGALVDRQPARDLLVSPNHALFLDGVLVEAGLLTNGASIATQAPAGQIDYFNIELGSHDVILAEGAPAETFLDRDCRDMFQNAADYRALYPGAAADPEPVFYARRVADGAALAAIRARIDARAGPRAGMGAGMGAGMEAGLGLAAGPAPRGHLIGWIDRLDRHGVAGWVIDADRPGTAVELEIVLDGAAVLRVVANRYRGDLLHLGDGAGRCSFDVGWPVPLDPHTRHVVLLRRVADGAAIPGAPAILEAAAPFAEMTPALERAVAEVCGSGDPAAIDGAAAVLLNSIEILRADAGGRAAERAARAARFRVGADARRPARPPAADAA